MFNRIKSKTYIALCVASHTVEEYAYRKARRTLHRQEEQYNEMIAESQAKIGPYIPTPCPVQIWA